MRQPTRIQLPGVNSTRFCFASSKTPSGLSPNSLRRPLPEQDADGVARGHELIRRRALSALLKVEDDDVMRALVRSVQVAAVRIDIKIPRCLAAAPRPALIPHIAAAL